MYLLNFRSQLLDADQVQERGYVIINRNRFLRYVIQLEVASSRLFLWRLRIFNLVWSKTPMKTFEHLPYILCNVLFLFPILIAILCINMFLGDLNILKELPPLFFLFSRMPILFLTQQGQFKSSDKSQKNSLLKSHKSIIALFPSRHAIIELSDWLNAYMILSSPLDRKRYMIR